MTSVASPDKKEILKNKRHKMRHLVVILIIALVQLLNLETAQACTMTHRQVDAGGLMKSDKDKQQHNVPQLDQCDDTPTLDVKDPNTGIEVFNRDSKLQARNLLRQLRQVTQYAQQWRAAIKTTTISLQRHRSMFNYCEARATVSDGYVFAIRHIII